MKGDRFSFFVSLCSTRRPCCACSYALGTGRFRIRALLGLVAEPGSGSLFEYKKMLIQTNPKTGMGAAGRPIAVRAAACLYRRVLNGGATPHRKLSMKGHRRLPGAASKMGRFSRRGVRGESAVFGQAEQVRAA